MSENPICCRIELKSRSIRILPFLIIHASFSHHFVYFCYTLNQGRPKKDQLSQTSLQQNNPMARLASLRIGILATVCATLIRLVNSNPVQTTTVKPGQCIQAAIDAAKPGTTIVVKAGTYAEQLTIKKDGIALVGQKGTILIPPTPQIPDAKQNECFGTAGPGRIAGICVAGKALVLEKWDPVAAEHQKVTSVGRRVKGVSITGFEIRGFSGENIALYGAENASVKKTTLVDGLRYGFLTAGSKDTDARGNKGK